MNGRGAIHCNVANDASLHEPNQERREAGLHDVTAEHDDHGLLFLGRLYDGIEMGALAMDAYRFS